MPPDSSNSGDFVLADADGAGLVLTVGPVRTGSLAREITPGKHPGKHPRRNTPGIY